MNYEVTDEAARLERIATRLLAGILAHPSTEVWVNHAPLAVVSAMDLLDALNEEAPNGVEAGS